MGERHSIRFGLSIVAALAIWIAAIIQTLEAFEVTASDEVDPPLINSTTVYMYRKLDPQTLKNYFAYKRTQMGYDISIDLLFSLGFLCLAYCVLCLKRVFKRYKHGNTDVPNLMAGLFFFGALIPSLTFLDSVGNTTTASWISGWPGLADEGFQILYISSIMNQGKTLYLYSMQFLFISLGLALASYLSWNTAQLPRKHAVLGYVTSAVGFLTFIFEISSFQAERGNPVVLVFGLGILLWGIILLPSWTIWLGVELRRLKDEEDHEKKFGMDNQMVEKQQESTNFT